MNIDEQYLPIADVAKEAGATIRTYFNQVLEIEQKSIPSDLRTEADLASEKIILEGLTKHYPEYNIQSEESGFHDRGSEYTFVVDPLDGTHNFVIGRPLFSVAIALVKGESAIASVVYDVVLDRLYMAQKGKGSFCNGQPLRVNNVSEITHASVAFGKDYPVALSHEDHMRLAATRLEMKRLITNWSIAIDLCLLASGKIEAMICDGNPHHDIAAGLLIAKEAGAKVTDHQGNLLDKEMEREVVVTNGTKIHETLVEVTKGLASA